MSAGFTVVWGLALLAIAALVAVLVLTLRRGERAVSFNDSEARDPDLVRDTLLFYYEPDGVRSTANGRVIVHIPGAAWDDGWREDLLRLEVVQHTPDAVTFPGELGAAEVLAVYDLVAYRMTEMGTDIEVDRFLEPVDVVLTSDRQDCRLGLVTQTDGSWVMAPPADVSLDDYESIRLPPDERWASAAVVRPGKVCLVRLFDEGGTEE